MAVALDMSNHRRPRGQQPLMPLAVENLAKTPDYDYGYVSTMYKCQTKDASKLCIHDIAFKLKNENTYDIGGTYTDKESDFWFYYTTTVCPKRVYLINLFVCHRKAGNFSIGIANSNKLTNTTLNDDKKSTLPDTLTWYQFKNAQRDENHYVKTFFFTDMCVSLLENSTLIIPLTIHLEPKFTLNSDILKSIKLQYDFSGLLLQKEKTDIVLQSASAKEFPAHKIILAAHSPILRNLIKNTSLLFLDISDNDMELLLHYIYTGTIKNILNQDSLKLIEIADKFQLKALYMLTQHLIAKQINVNNAVEVALLAKKHKLDDLQNNAFSFINSNPEVMSSDGWKQLHDVELAKCLFQHTQKTNNIM